MTGILAEPFVHGWNNKVKCHNYNILKVRNPNSLHIFKVIFGQYNKIYCYFGSLRGYKPLLIKRRPGSCFQLMFPDVWDVAECLYQT